MSHSPPLPRPNKRARHSDGPDSPLADVEHDPDFWLEDGNIVVVAQNTAFRVHRGVLARRSEVFSGLFTVPQPEYEVDVEKIDGCPVVRVQDSLHDFKHFLHALYDGMDAYVMEKGPVKFSSLAALLRLSHKYEVHHVQDAALRRLRPAFPDNFEAWKTYESSTLDFGPLNVRGAAMASRQVSVEPGEPIEAVNLLRRCGYDAMLLIALHMCTTLDMHNLLHGMARADGTRETLAMDDLERCLVARETLQGRNAEFNRRMLDSESSGSGRPACATPAYCGRRARKARTVAVNTLRDEDGCESEIGRRMFFVGLLSKAPELVKVCDTCVKHVLSSERQFVQELWNDLPAIMGLEVSPWPPNSEAASS